MRDNEELYYRPLARAIREARGESVDEPEPEVERPTEWAYSSKVDRQKRRLRSLGTFMALMAIFWFEGYNLAPWEWLKITCIIMGVSCLSLGAFAHVTTK